ncbi:hypothetical protein SEA_ZETA1847_38 [Microbacterium phage Zeta1847]|uniref:Uncharacterized protein n=1 Tax=Microbacterium phage Zeta1847 TaxID=2201444 RepID=A0A2Z4Q9D4_9CAUD|nr:hypothetical protein HOT46_gp38 [Microbacterium phage Zeta1847]AWY06672.1 hypothetical protein SEA_ZETA1847_38 [Microbacterium phage Zeta1847]
MASPTRRYIVVDDPTFTDGPYGRRILDGPHAPRVGDVVEALPGVHPDADGDLLVEFKGTRLHVGVDALASVDKLIAERGVTPLADWERELLRGMSYHEVTIARPLVKPTALADVLITHGMSGETAEVLTALAIMRSLED